MEAELIFGLNTAWVLLCAFLVFFMQAGFGMLEAGFVRAKNAINILMKNLIDLSVGIIGFFLLGFGLMFGPGNAFFGFENFAFLGLAEQINGVSGPAFFLFQAVFAATAATIVAGAVAERTKFLTYVLLSIIITSFIYPVVGHWIWHETGFLAKLGFIDFAGSTVVHTVGGLISLVAAIFVGPRLGRFDLTQAKKFNGHSIPLATLGMLILWFGWYGFNGGSQLAIDGANANAIGLITLNTTLAAAAGGLVSLFALGLYTRKLQAGPTLNGTLGGLVAITAGCASVTPLAALGIGVLGGLAVQLATIVIARLKIDDVVGAFPVHGCAGIVGTLAVGLFALEGGLFYGGGLEQLGIQTLGILATICWTVGTASIVLFILKKVMKLRVSQEVELAGLDEHKHGVSAYPDFEHSKV